MGECSDDKDPSGFAGRRLSEPARFAYAALCAVSLGQLFQEKEQRSYSMEFIDGLVKWLQLSDSVIPAMVAFANGLGGEGTENFVQLLLEEPVLKESPVIITQDLMSFALKDGYYDARARVLISHITGLLRVPVEAMEIFEESLLETLKERKPEPSESAEASRKKKETRKKLKRYFLIGLATVGGGTVIASFAAPWHSLMQSSEQYCLAWESKYLMELGNTLDLLLNGLVNMVAQEALKFTVLSGIISALVWPTSLLAVASVIDNPWGVCLSRSAEVGKHLAHLLLSRQQGKRPVTLIGFSLGARVIYFCLQEMAQEKDCEGIIEDVVLLGAPVEGDAKYWKPLTRVVAGRIINGYCRGDWLLSFVYRSSSVKLNVAGLQPVNLDDRRMVNVDLSSVVKGHLDYMKQMDTLLKVVGVKTKECHMSSFIKKSMIPAEDSANEEDACIGTDNASEDCDHWCWEPVPRNQERLSSSTMVSESSIQSESTRIQKAVTPEDSSAVTSPCSSVQVLTSCSSDIITNQEALGSTDTGDPIPQSEHCL
uniref:Transmembrane and coiled-coil domain-containing protein 4 isoform X3 n=1 Tax=Geotrypetes seraphini TaxID=260995 RepID=A0A6P8NP83_GEOSA|nr:transmembrane and coiled-coil domain-containing protein 4 isoform X3 [Geotrypetes seraphini]